MSTPESFSADPVIDPTDPVSAGPIPIEIQAVLDSCLLAVMNAYGPAGAQHVMSVVYAYGSAVQDRPDTLAPPDVSQRQYAVTESSEVVGLSTLQRSVISLLTRARTVSELSDLAGRPVSSIRSILYRLRRLGLVTEAQGLWVLR